MAASRYQTTCLFWCSVMPFFAIDSPLFLFPCPNDNMIWAQGGLFRRPCKVKAMLEFCYFLALLCSSIVSLCFSHLIARPWDCSENLVEALGVSRCPLFLHVYSVCVLCFFMVSNFCIFDLQVVEGSFPTDCLLGIPVSGAECGCCCALLQHFAACKWWL